MKNKLLSFILAITMVFVLFPAFTAQALETAALGTTRESVTAGNTYTISTQGELAHLCALINGGQNCPFVTFVLTNDIDIGNTRWPGIGSEENLFSGTFDGAGYTIKRNGTYDSINVVNIGIFGYVGSSGTVKNLTVDGADFGEDHVGGVAVYNFGYIQNCCSNVTLSYLGVAQGARSTYFRFGGIVAENHGVVIDCCNNGAINDTDIDIEDYWIFDVGGVVGRNLGTVINCYNTGNVKAEEDTGGVVGYNIGTVENSYNTGNINVVYSRGGGIVGVNTGAVKNCYNTGFVSGPYVSGVAGRNMMVGTVENSYWLSGTSKNGVMKDEGTSTNVVAFTSTDGGTLTEQVGDNTSLLAVLNDYITVHQATSYNLWVAGTDTYTYPVLNMSTGVNDIHIVPICGLSCTNNAITISEAGDYVISGTTVTQRIIVSGTGIYNLILSGLSITSSVCAFEIKDGATVNITLKPGSVNTLNSGSVYSGLQKNSASGTLTIDGAGTLTATGGADGGAGIGGGLAVTTDEATLQSANGVAGTGIIIAGGNITAVGNGGGAGIGGSGGYGTAISGIGMNGGAGDVTITGGTVLATANGGGAGIGGGGGSAATDSIGGEIGGGATVTVSGGTIVASTSTQTNGIGSGLPRQTVSIGGGSSDDGSSITITGGSVNATMGSRPTNGTSDVYKTVLQFPYADIAVTELKWNSSDYGGPGMVTDSSKCVYLWLTYQDTLSTDGDCIQGVQKHRLYGASFCVTNDSDTPYVLSAADYDLGWYIDKSSPYTISTALELRGLAAIVNGTAYTVDGAAVARNDFFGETINLASNIYLIDNLFTPVGTNAETPFKGVFDGKGYRVSGLKVTGADYAGLFGYNYGTIQNIGVSGNVSGTNYVGGIAGYNHSYIINCYSAVDVSGASDVGGIAGTNYNGTVSNCYVTGNVSGTGDVGGVVGKNNLYVSDCYWLSGTTVKGIGNYENDAIIDVNVVQFNSENGGMLLSSVNGTNSLLTALNLFVAANREAYPCLISWVSGTGSSIYPVFSELTDNPVFLVSTYIMPNIAVTEVGFTLTNAIEGGTYRLYSAETGGSAIDTVIDQSGDTLTFTLPAAPESDAVYYVSAQDVTGSKPESQRVQVSATAYVSVYTITATAGAGGSISPSGSVSVTEDYNQTFTIVPDDYYSIASVTVDGVNQGAISSYDFISVMTNHTISAVFNYIGGSPSNSNTTFYLPGTLTDGISGVTISGSLIQQNAQLVVTENDPQTINTGNTFSSIHELYEHGHVLHTFGITLFGEFRGAVTLRFPVGSQLDGHTLTIAHILGDAMELFYPTVLGGNVAITVTSLSPFVVLDGVYDLDIQDNPFIDINENDWFYDNVLYAYHNGLMNGTAADVFSPKVVMTRAMLVTVLWRMEGEPAMGNGKSGTFGDVDENLWFTEAIEWAAANGIVLGYGNSCFGPEDNLSRQDMAVILYRYAQYKGYDVSVGENKNTLSYNDAFDISEYAIPAMQWACGAGLIQGYDSNLTPLDGATRAQTAAIIQRLIENVAQ